MLLRKLVPSSLVKQGHEMSLQGPRGGRIEPAGSAGMHGDVDPVHGVEGLRFLAARKRSPS